MSTTVRRRLPIGAELIPSDGVHFRVWAPRRNDVAVVLDGAQRMPLEREASGYFSGTFEKAKAGTLYQFQLDRSQELFPDPASRFQPLGPDGPSQVVDSSSFHWTDRNWPGIRLHGQVIYELHVGTYTAAGTWAAAREHLPSLAELGITSIEVMPVADFPGNFGWGYDGVNMFAPTRLYGSPDDLRGFIDTAHQLGMGVILDVVYNHFGPAGNHIMEFSSSYFSKKYKNEWGEPINYDGPDSAPVREFFVSNARYWISEFHLDGLRLDATQQIFDSSRENILAELTRAARQAADGRSILVLGENEAQDVRLIRAPRDGGFGLDALWNDDFHHAARVAATGRKEAYFSDYLGTPQEFISAIRWGFLYQGQYFRWQKKTRGQSALDIAGEAFVTYLQNHDQVANSAYGQRLPLLTSPGQYRTLTALLLLAPGTPMLFQGQEFGASSPFFYFADHKEDLAALVAHGRKAFLSQFPSATDICLPAPHEEGTFLKCKLDHNERERKGGIVALHRDLLRLRREDPVFSRQRSDSIHGAVIGPNAFVLRFFGDNDDHRLLLVNLGVDLRAESIAEPLLASPSNRSWQLLWTSEDSSYGGSAPKPVDDRSRLHIPGYSATVLKASAEGARQT